MKFKSREELVSTGRIFIEDMFVVHRRFYFLVTFISI